ncbi:MAG: rhodanese-like domain-containing protein [Pseudomonadota bacterium]
MRRTIYFLMGMLFFSHVAGCSPADGQNKESRQQVSGDIIGGYRVIPIQNSDEKVHLTVYRGDYIKFKCNETVKDLSLSIPALSISQALPERFENAPFFKMKKSGTFEFTIGDIKGELSVIEYRQARYREATSQEAAEFIKNNQPLILDVRTPGEYQRGHLKDAVLIPVQVLSGQLEALSAYKDKEILVYCATGNRSTVASKILIDNGFERITNMRYGIADWQAKRYPVVQ